MQIARPYFYILSVLFVFACIFKAGAQQTPTPVPGAPVTLQNAPQRDTSNKTNTSEWRDEKARISYERLYSKKSFYPDTQIHNLHRRELLGTWYRDLGNAGSPARNLLFMPQARTGPTLGYHSFDVYRFHTDSLRFYNTTRPYSNFSYQLGSRAEQMAELLHTQNINPRWNVALQYRKINSPGNYKVQRTNHDLGNLTTNYTSGNLRYKAQAAFAYNKIQHDENGGIVSDSFLTDESFDDRRTIPVRFQNDQYSNRRSAVTTTQWDFTALLLHSYTFGRGDTLYSADSTSYSYRLLPRFRVSHRLQLSTEKYQYKDLRPDSLRYAHLFPHAFAAQDSVFTEQKWFYVDNALLLNGFAGPEDKQLLFTAGIGNRFDRFRTEYGTGAVREDQISNYLTGALEKEALAEGQWTYLARGKFFITGPAAGNLQLQAALGKDFGRRIGNVRAGFEQRINNAPYNYSYYQNQYFQRSLSFNKETVSLIHGGVQNDRFEAAAGLRNYLITNYIYIDQQEQPAQWAPAFNITQVWLKKVFRLGIWVLDNDVAWQQKAGTAPVNVPAFMGRHQLSIETLLFGNALKIATGIDARWHSGYEPAAYSPFLNRFYYQDTYTVSNAPELAVFFNFKIKQFRAYVMGDQLQTFFARNIITAPGYPAQDAMIRFGFSWVMIN